MQYWHFLLIGGFILIIIEMLAPMMFFLNLAFACFITAFVAFFIKDWNILIPVFVVFSACFLLFLRPLLIKNKENGKKTGLEEKYLGKIAKVKKTITSNSGVVSIYNERWEARSENGEEIPEGSDVKIVRNESLILYVKSEA